MNTENLQKSAEHRKNDETPKEVLNPRQTAQHYTFHTYLASEALVPFVDYYWIMRWDLTHRPPFIAEVVPSPYTNLTFMPEGARITGVTTGKYTYELKNEGAIVGVKFKPGGLHAFAHKSLHEITDTFIPASEVFAAIDEPYNKQMLKLSDKEAVATIERLLLAKQPIADKKLELVTLALAYLESAEHPTLSSVSAHAGLSERRLQEIFRDCVGVGVKWIILRARLLKAVELAGAHKNRNWTAIAHNLGYGDQSHFINDFKRVIGKTPAQYAADAAQ